MNRRLTGPILCMGLLLLGLMPTTILAATKGFPGVSGKITFDANRSPVARPAVILRFEKGRSLYVKTITGG